MFKALLAKFLIDKLFEVLGQLLSKIIAAISERQQAKRDAKNNAEYKEAIQDGTTEDQLDSATDDLLNGGRK